jgi:hypothetical protein
LRLERNWIRTDPNSSSDASEFSNLIPPESCVIVTSSGREDGGGFAQAMREDRYGPFEGAGAVSQWGLSLPPDFRHFPYRTISDVVVHLSFTALEGARIQTADALRTKLDALKLDDAHTGMYHLISARSDFPDDWYRYTTSPAGAKLTLTLSREMLPYVMQATAKAGPDGIGAMWAPSNGQASVATSAPVEISGPDAGPWTVTVDPPVRPWSSGGQLHFLKVRRELSFALSVHQRVLRSVATPSLGLDSWLELAENGPQVDASYLGGRAFKVSDRPQDKALCFLVPMPVFLFQTANSIAPSGF